MDRTGRLRRRIARYGDGFIGNGDLCDIYAEKMRDQGKDMSSAKVRATELFLVVAEDPEQALEELAPHYQPISGADRAGPLRRKARSLNPGQDRQGEADEQFRPCDRDRSERRYRDG